MENKNELVITREFDAPLDLVWRVHTEAKHLEHWWGPKGFELVVKQFDFRPGGLFHYGMKGNDGNIMWGRFMYREIEPQIRLVFINSFADENGAIAQNPFMQPWPLEMLTSITFEEKNNKTLMVLRSSPIDANEEEHKIFLEFHENMQQGFKGTYDKMDEYIATL